MTPQKGGADCKDGSCTLDTNNQTKQQQQDGKLVRSTELPLTGNPYPPRDVIQNERPTSIELAVRSVRTTMQPYLSPICSAYAKASDILSIGAAHTQSTIQSLAENQSSVGRASFIAASGLFGVLLARRKGFIKKFLYGSTLFGGALAVCYPNEAKEKAELAWFIARNNLPTLVAHQYERISGKTPTTSETEKKEDKN